MKHCLFILVFIAALFSFTSITECATYYYDTNLYSWSRSYATHKDVEAQVVGHNTTHGITKNLTYYFDTIGSGTSAKWRIYYIVPDDGSTWVVSGLVYVRENWGDFSGQYHWTNTLEVHSETFNRTHSTSGTYSGPSIKAATDAATAAKNSANSAKSSADAAKSAADTAAARSYYNSNTAGYWSYNSYSKANSANTNAINAKSSADAAKSAADAAKSSADTAAAQAATAAAQATIAATEAATAATKATSAANQTIYNGESAAYWAYIASINTSNDTIAPVINKVEGQNGATCTTGSTFTVVINASDNGPDGNLRYRVNCDGYDSGWVSNNNVTITGLSTGSKTATIKVSDNPSEPDSGNVSQTTYTFFKI